MKRWVVTAVAVSLIAGCSSAVEKHFKVFADPADAEITVISGKELKELKYHSPAHITARVPNDPELAGKTFLEVQHENYKPFTMPLTSIRDGQTLNVKLVKQVANAARYKLSVRLVSPKVSDTLQFRDAYSFFSFSVADTAVQMRFENHTSYEVKLLWDRSEYTDVIRYPHRLMHSGIRFPDRHNPVPDQIVPAHASVQEGLIPVSSVVYSQQKKNYEVKPLFSLDNDSAMDLKGKVFNLFIPVEVDRQIVPYNFRFEITGVVKEPAAD